MASRLMTCYLRHAAFLDKEVYGFFEMFWIVVILETLECRFFRNMLNSDSNFLDLISTLKDTSFTESQATQPPQTNVP